MTNYMKGYIVQIEDATLKNENYRQVLFTAKHCQLVIMNGQAGDQIGEEIHDLDQFIRVEAGEGVISMDMDGQKHAVSDGFAAVIPAGTKHNVINTSSSLGLKLYSLYSPPEHKVGTVHKTKKMLTPMDITASMARLPWHIDRLRDSLRSPPAP
jgi:mannose-6-phosphate isomerase-like protein (cupin superfamily)